jgi:hypothetical protein
VTRSLWKKAEATPGFAEGMERARQQIASGQTVPLRTLYRATPEDALLTAVVDALRRHGWLVHHDRRSDKALQQGDAGFPDVVAVLSGRDNEPGRLLFLELKSELGNVYVRQREWILSLQEAGADVRVLRPSGLDGFLEELG